MIRSAWPWILGYLVVLAAAVFWWIRIHRADRERDEFRGDR